MSNTSTVSSYAQDSGVGATEVAFECATAVIQWLLQETPEEKAAVERMKAHCRRERLATGKATSEPSRLQRPSLVSIPLHLRDPESLAQSAERLGYRRTSPHLASPDRSSWEPILMRNASGERLAITTSREGRVVVHAGGERRRVEALVRRHTIDCVAAHFARAGMAVEVQPLSGGEVQMVARERRSPRGDGLAVVETRVSADGNLSVDVDGLRGSRCDEIVQDIARAVGGKVTRTRKKEVLFTLPGEPTRTRVRVQ